MDEDDAGPVMSLREEYLTSWPTFSSRVMRPSKARTRSSTEAEATAGSARTEAAETKAAIQMTAMSATIHWGRWVGMGEIKMNRRGFGRRRLLGGRAFSEQSGR